MAPTCELRLDTQENLPANRSYRTILAVMAHHETLQAGSNEELLISAMQQTEQMFSAMRWDPGCWVGTKIWTRF